MKGRMSAAIAVTLALAGLFSATAAEIAPVRLVSSSASISGPLEVLSEKSLKVAIAVDRDAARVVASAIEDRPFLRVGGLDEPRSEVVGGIAQLEVVLRGAREETFTRRFDFGPLCFEHPAWTGPHVLGDTILLHQDTFVIELPVREGLDRLEIASYRSQEGSQARVLLGSADLGAKVTSGAELTTGAVSWPADHADPEVVAVYGDAADGNRRTNIIIVPDGYTYADKPTMKSHADNMVAYFRGKTPYKEHDPFLNYVLVFAYSTASGTDQCDCSIVVDTAMATAFNLSNPTCGHSDNRCLYYGSGCDPTANHIAEAEMRAPGFDYAMGDRTIVMVNTARYGGCGGTRAVYSAANGSATEVAVHELGHSFAGLADEYESYTGCGSGAGEINTSSNAVNGAWPEWIADIGAPRQGGQYYPQCIYRPAVNCDMRALNQPFCAVCSQRFSLIFFGKPRVQGTAPLASVSPFTPTSAYVGVPKSFAIGTRFAIGPGVTNDIQWLVHPPGAPSYTTIASGVTSVNTTFTVEGTNTLRCIITADTNFIKPSKNGTNLDVYDWTVTVTLPPPSEVSPPGAVQPVTFATPTSLAWDAAGPSGSTTFNVYRGDLSALPAASYGTCLASGLVTSGYDDAATPASEVGWFYLIAGRTSGGQGPLGNDSSGNPRIPAASCP